jgi:WD40 repeat protein
VSHPDGAIVRVLTRSGSTAGAGVLIGAREIVTCAHVVNAALERDLGSRAVPAEPVEVTFPLTGGRWPIKVRVAQWFPPTPDGEVNDDLAVLLLGRAPNGAVPARLAVGSYRSGHGADVFGYPGVPPRPDGSWVPVAVRGVVGGGLLQLDARSSAALRVQPGFSGGPVIDSETGEVIGLLQTAPPARSADRDSYAIPAGRIVALRGAGADPQAVQSGMTPYVFHLLTGHTRPTEHREAVSCAAFSPDGAILATGCADGTVRLWDTRSRETTGVLQHPAAVTSAAFHRDGEILATGCADDAVRLWDTRTWAVSDTLAHTAAVTAMTFHDTGQSIVTGSADGAVKLWDLGTRAPLASFVQPSAVTLVGFSRPDGMIAARGTDGTVLLWQNLDGDDPRTITSPGLDPVQSAQVTALSQRATIVAVGLPDGTVQLSDVTTAQSTSTWWLEYNPSGSVILYSAPDGTYYARNIGPPAGSVILAGHIADVTSLAFSADTAMLACGGADGTVRLWTFEDTRYVTGREDAAPDVLAGHTGGVHALAFSPDGTTLASGSADATIRLWDIATETNTDVLTGHTDVVNSVAFIWNGAAVISGGADREARVWVLSQRGRNNPIGLPDDMWALAFAHEAAGDQGDDGMESRLSPIPGDSRTQRSVAFAPDGKTCAFVLDDNRVMLKDYSEGPWSTVTNSDSGSASDSGLMSVAFSRDGSMLAVCAADGTFRTYPVALAAAELAELAEGTDPGSRIWDCVPAATIAFFPRSMNSIAFSPDGTLVATGSLDGAVRLWDVASATTIAAFTGHAGSVNEVVFSPHGDILATGGDDATIRLWRLGAGRCPPVG